jgi:demethylmenaquinone methyltransferase/2-methoxy-6-polyprenyl-1,4-benzoquinol methylase
MAKTFFVPVAQRAAKVRELFDTVADRYDCINDLQSFGLHRYWKHRLLQLTGVQPGDRVLDVCCGTGDIALSLARCGAWVVGLDFSGPMLSVAYRRARSGLPSQLHFVQADALRLPFRDACFDIVTMGYGLRNLANCEGGLRELHRVAKRGGRLVLLDFGKPLNRVWRALYFAYLRTLVPLHGRFFCGDASAYGYILESLKHYPAQEGVADLMHNGGWQRVRVFNFLGGIMSIHYAEKGE